MFNLLLIIRLNLVFAKSLFKNNFSRFHPVQSTADPSSSLIVARPTEKPSTFATLFPTTKEVQSVSVLATQVTSLESANFLPT